MRRAPLREALQACDVLITVGSGGVGKTTLAATLALRAAMEGKGSLVCTIDPARRLANALGLEAGLGNTPTAIGDEAFLRAGLNPLAPMEAMMLDLKGAWDAFIERHAPEPRRQQILQSRFYQALSTALAGSQEYIAMEKLCELHEGRRAPLIVLDTPPTAHALDFLEAPGRVLDLLDSEASRFLLTPALAAGRFGLRLLNLGSSFTARALSRITGAATLQQLAEFMLALSSLNEEFRGRAQQTRALLEAPTTGFVLVTGPASRHDEVVAFHELLTAQRMYCPAVVVNRVHAPPPDAWGALVEAEDEPLRSRLRTTLEESQARARLDVAGLEALARAVAPTPLVLVPRFSQEVNELAGLYEASRYVWGEAQL